jgi:protein TonB
LPDRAEAAENPSVFDAVLRRETLPKRRFGAGAAIALSIWAGLAVLAPRLRADAPDSARDVAVTFVRPPAEAAPPPPPPPPPARATKARARPEPRPPVVKPLVAPAELPREAPAAVDPQPASAVASAPGGVEGGEAGGVEGGVVGGVLPAIGGGRLDFDERMTPPMKLSGPNPQYTEKALEREVEGTMVVRCVVATDGKVSACRVLKGLPYMDRAVIEALEQRRYRPATLAGRPVEVSYDFKITLRLR